MTPPISTPVQSPPPPPLTPAPSNSKATIALVLGILSLVCCGFLAGIPAIILGRSELKAIDEGRSPETNRTLAKVGWILGLVGTILSVVGAIVYILIIVLAVTTGSMQNMPSTF